MAINSTSKMLASMVGKKTNAVSVADVSEFESEEPKTQPQLKPSPDMEHALSQILGASLSKKNTPME